MKIINILNLTKFYNNQKNILYKIFFFIKNNDFYSILGNNGVGKSTLIKIITSIIKKSSGYIYIYNYNIDIYNNYSKIKKIIGYIPQHNNTFVFESILDTIKNQAGYYNIEKKLIYSRTKFLLLNLNLWNKRYYIYSKLSGGIKKCISILKSLIHNPLILILDEPFNNMDIYLYKLLCNLFKNLNKKGINIIISTHSINDIEFLCNKIILIKNNKIIINSKIKKLKKINEYIFNLNINNIYFDIKFIHINIKKKKIINMFILFKIYNIYILNINIKCNKLKKIFLN